MTALCAAALVVSVGAVHAQDSTGRGRGRGRAGADSTQSATRGGRSGNDSSQAAATGRGSSAGSRGGDSTTGRAGARGGGRGRNTSIVLGAADIAKAVRDVIEATISVSGDLRALESAIVRSRIDGIIERVYVREGQTVASGATLAKFESSEQEASLRSSEADIAAATSDAATAKWNAEQSRELFKVGAIAERDLRLAEQAADAATARLAASQARQRAAANVVRDTRATAPFAGTIEKRLVQDGENTPRGTQMFTMVRTSTLELLGSVPARRADDIKPGQTVRFTADERSFTGRVARVSPTIDPATRAVAVYVTVPNPRGALKGNTFASGQIVTTTIPGALVVPSTAVRNNVDGSQQFVYRIKGDELELAYIKTGIVDEARGTVQVLSGLKEQEQVVVGAPGTLGPGMKVQVIGNEGRRGQRPPS